MSPYADGEKQRRIMKQRMREKYKKAKGFDVLKESSITPLAIWMKFAKKDDHIEVRLVKVGETWEFPLPVLSVESMVRTLRKYNFPDKVEVWNKRFVLKCVEVEEE